MEIEDNAIPKELEDSLNDIAGLSQDLKEKIGYVNEYIYSQHPQYLVDVSDRILPLQASSNNLVKKFVLKYLNTLCSKNPKSIHDHLYLTLYTIYSNSDSSVKEEVISSLNSIYRELLQYFYKNIYLQYSYLISNKDEKAIWNGIYTLEEMILDSFLKDNNKVRKCTVKFIRTVILCFTYPSDNKIIRPPIDANTFTLQDIPLTHPFLNRNILEERANQYIDFLCDILTNKKICETPLDHIIINEIINTLRNLGTTRIALLQKLLSIFELCDNTEWSVDTKYYSIINRNLQSGLKILKDHFDHHKKLAPQMNKKRELLNMRPDNYRSDYSHLEHDEYGNIISIEEALSFPTEYMVDTIFTNINNIPILSKSNNVNNGITNKEFLRSIYASENEPVSSSNIPNNNIVLNEDECYELSNYSLERLFKQLSTRNENDFPNCYKWWAMLVKLLCSLSYNNNNNEIDKTPPIFDTIIHYITTHGKVELCSLLMYQSLLIDLSEDHIFYRKVTMSIITKLIENLHSKDSNSLISIYNDCPLLHKSFFEPIREMCTTEGEDKLRDIGLSLLKEVVLNRSESGYIAMEVLLYLTSLPQKSIRTASIKLVVQSIYGEGYESQIENFSKQQIQLLQVDPSTLEGNNNNNNNVLRLNTGATNATTTTTTTTTTTNNPTTTTTTDKEGKEKTIWPKIDLLIALCTKKYSLMNEIRNLYKHTDITVQKAIYKFLPRLLQEMKKTVDPFEIIKCITDDPDGAEGFILLAINEILKGNKINEEIKKYLENLYQIKNNDVRYIVPLFSSYEADKILELLPSIIKLKGSELKLTLTSIIPESETTEITPVQMIVNLHLQDINNYSSNIRDAITYCIKNLYNIYTREVITESLKQLYDKKPFPTLAVETTALCFLKYESTKNFLLDLVKLTIKNKIWSEDMTAWNGLIKFMIACGNEGYDLMGLLQEEQLNYVFSLFPQLEQNIRNRIRIKEIESSN